MNSSENGAARAEAYVLCPVFIFERCNRLLLKVIADIAKSGILAQPRLWRRRLARRWWRGRYAAHGERVAEAKKLQICTIRPIARGRKKERFVKAVGQRVYKNCGIALAVAFGTCLLAINGFRFEVSDRGIGAYEKMCARCLLGSVTFQTAPIIVRKSLVLAI